MQKSRHILDFGVSSTESTVTLSFAGTPDSVLVSRHKNAGEQQLIDISNWGKGLYRVQLTAIAESCVFELDVK